MKQCTVSFRKSSKCAEKRSRRGVVLERDGSSTVKEVLLDAGGSSLVGRGELSREVRDKVDGDAHVGAVGVEDSRDDNRLVGGCEGRESAPVLGTAFERRRTRRVGSDDGGVDEEREERLKKMAGRGQRSRTPIGNATERTIWFAAVLFLNTAVV